MQGRPNINIRFDTKAQVDRIKRAAKLQKRSFNQIVVMAAEERAAEILTTDKPSDPLTAESNRPALNQ